MPGKISRTSGSPGFPGSSFTYGPLRHVRVLFVSFVQGLFAEAPPGCYRWCEDLQTTEIVIQDSNTLNQDVIGKRPLITFTRGPIQFYSLGLDDLETYDFRSGTKQKGVLIPGTMAINCCSRSDLESEQIAWIVAEHLWLLRELLIRQGFFDIGRSIQIGSPSDAGQIIQNDQGEEWYATAVSVPYQFARLSQFTPLGQQIVRSIDQNLQLNLDSPPAIIPTGSRFNESHEPLPYQFDNSFPSGFVPAGDLYNQTPDPAGVRSYTLPKIPSPSNTAQLVETTLVKRNDPAIKPPRYRGRVLPIK